MKIEDNSLLVDVTVAVQLIDQQNGSYTASLSVHIYTP